MPLRVRLLLRFTPGASTNSVVALASRPRRKPPLKPAALLVLNAREPATTSRPPLKVLAPARLSNPEPYFTTLPSPVIAPVSEKPLDLSVASTAPLAIWISPVPAVPVLPPLPMRNVPALIWVTL